MWSKYLFREIVEGTHIEVIENQDSVFLYLSDGDEDGNFISVVLNKKFADAIVEALSKAACANLEPPKINDLVVYEESTR